MVQESQTNLTVDNIGLENLSEEQQHTVRSMLERYSPMWKGQLGEVTRAQHRIDLAPGARPVYSQPHRAGPSPGRSFRRTSMR